MIVIKFHRDGAKTGCITCLRQHWSPVCMCLAAALEAAVSALCVMLLVKPGAPFPCAHIRALLLPLMMLLRPLT